MEYELCPTCKKPLINKKNLKILRIRIGLYIGGGVGVTIGCGVLGAFALPLLGFGSAGVTAGSFAASIQGPAVAAGSIFAICQSLGATGVGAILFGTVGTAVGGAVGGGALGLLYHHREAIGWCGCVLPVENNAENAA